MIEQPTFPMAVAVSDLFVDHTYQRECDTRRVDKIAAAWDPRLAGVLDVSDRGENTQPRYAIINGQHRWAAATQRDPNAHLVVNVHTSLTVPDEAKLFNDIDKGTKALTNWDRWYARRASGDTTVTDIERIVSGCGLNVTHHPGSKNLQCCSTLERIWNRSEPSVLADTLILILDIWPGDTDAFKSGPIEGTALVIDLYPDDVHLGRLGDAMSSLTPKQLHARAKQLQEQGTKGNFPQLIAHVLVGLYNRSAGAKLRPLTAVLAERKRG